MTADTTTPHSNIRPELTGRAHPIADFHPHPRNYRHGDLVTIATSLQTNGQYRPIIVQKSTGYVCAGNHTLLAARQLGWTHIAADILDLDDDDAARILAIDNAASDRAINDDQALAELLAELEQTDHGLAGTGYDTDDLEALFASLENAIPDSAGPPLSETSITAREELPTRGIPRENDEPQPTQAEPDPITEPGDVWLLGRHRLLCGSSLSPEDLERALGGLYPQIIYSDPPYGIKAVGKDGKVGDKIGYPRGGINGRPDRKTHLVPTTRYLPVIGDDSTDTARDAFHLLTTAYPADTPRHIWWGANHYVHSAGLPDASCWLVWDKQTNGGFADAELAWTNHKGSVRRLVLLWNGLARAEREKRIHPTQKPVGLARWSYGVVDPDGVRVVVLDPFAGSGSSLLAAEQTNRTAVLLELEPYYCDAIARRWQQHTGQVPVLERRGVTTEHDLVATP